jgi:hypothetical protein
MDQCWAELRALEDLIPSPPRSLEDVVLRAEIAHFGADKLPDLQLAALDLKDCIEGPAARLILAVVQFAAACRMTVEGRVLP